MIVMLNLVNEPSENHLGQSQKCSDQNIPPEKWLLFHYWWLSCVLISDTVADRQCLQAVLEDQENQELHLFLFLPDAQTQQSQTTRVV